uniref:non-specific serine/threonine protein kinase n=1 Tax=Leersia perrieri TaxID=77586 RepID=A0A0D9X0P6_9ORYZ
MLIVSLLAFIYFLSVNSAGAAQPASNGRFVHHGFAAPAADLAMDGVASVMPSGLLVLTNATYQAKGHAFHPSPLRFVLNTSSSSATANGATVRSFSTSFVFAIVSDDPKGRSCHGLAFVVSPAKSFPTANAEQYLGLLNMTDEGEPSNHVFAVELDTLMNAEFGDIDSNHVGIDINSLTSLQAKTAGYYDDDDDGVFRSLQLNSKKPMQVWVDYDGQTRQLDVTLAPARAAKPRRPLLSAVVTFIFTNHYILGWSFSLDGPAPSLDTSMLPMVPHVGTKHRSVLLTVVTPIASVMFLVALVMVVFYFVKWWHRLYKEVREDWEVEFGSHRFVYKDLFHATQGFADRNLLGAGGFGRVYKGMLLASDSKMNGRLGDFGMSRLWDHGADAKTTHVVGTIGYIAPELMHTGKATPLTDVFAFGVFVLEVICGRRPIKYNEVILLDRVLEHFRNGSILEVVDPHLTGSFSY